MQISSIAFGGLSAAESQFNTAASNIAANSSGAAAPDTVDLSSSAVALLTAKDSYAANLTALQVADDMAKQTIDIMA
jgi:flagellar basal body rod protein FlgC